MAQTKIHQRLYEMLNTRNLVDNGSFEVWQRGSSYSGFADGQNYYADRWMVKKANLTANGGQATGYNSIGLCADISGNSVTSGAYLYLRYKIENSTFYNGQYISVSAMLKTNGTGITVKLAIHDSITRTDSSVLIGNDWQQLTVTKKISASSTQVLIYVGSLDAGDFPTGSGVHIQIDNVMAIVGDKPIDYIPTPVTEELIRCQRFYTSRDKLYMSGSASSVWGMTNSIEFPVTMYATPTLTKAGSGWTYLNTTGGGVNLFKECKQGFILYVIPTGDGSFTVSHDTTPWAAEITTFG